MFSFQRESFALYALYSKNKPQSDRLLINHGQSFFRVRSLPLLLIFSVLFSKAHHVFLFQTRDLFKPLSLLLILAKAAETGGQDGPVVIPAEACAAYQ